MNKTQINYFAARINACANRIIKQMTEDLPLKDEPTRAEKAQLIAAGKARFREELFTGPECPYHPSLFESFEFPGVDEIKAFNADRVAKNQKIEAAIRRKAERLIDELVMEKISPEDALDVLEKTKFYKKEK